MSVEVLRLRPRADVERVEVLSPASLKVVYRGPSDADVPALAPYLESGRLGGAAIDVYSAELLAADHALLALQGEAVHRVLFTPHIDGVTRQSAAFLYRAARRNVERVAVACEPLLNRVYSITEP